MRPERLQEPLRWRRPRLVFTCSMSDLFHEAVPEDFLLRVFQVIAQARQHTFQVLTKRPERLLQLVRRMDTLPPNVWTGVSVENQTWASWRPRILARVPAHVRFASCEPLLGPLDLRPWLSSGALQRVIVGGESGGPPTAGW